MKKSLLVILVLSIAAMMAYGCDDTSSSGGVCGESIRVSNTSAARLFYPCNISGSVGATTTSSGFLGTYQQVNWLSNRVAAAGFVVLSFTPTNQYGMVSGWRAAHKSCIAKLQELNSSHAKLRGKIDTGKLQTCGHSKGGGGSLWASSELRGDLKTTVGMAPYNGDISGTGAATEGPQGAAIRNITAATMIQAGAADTLATNTMTRAEYRFLGNISKKYYELNGYDHLAWAMATGTRADRLAGDIIAWMKYYMNGDSSQRGTIANESGARQFNWVDLTNGSGSGTGSTGSGSTGTGSTGGTAYSFVAVHSGKALDVWEWGTTDGTNIAQYDYWAGDAQKFYVSDADSAGYREIIPIIATGQRIEVANGDTYSGANIQTWSSNGYDAQKFQFQSTGSGVYRIISKASGLCVTVQNASMDDGANVIQDTCVDGATHQMFRRVTN